MYCYQHISCEYMQFDFGKPLLELEAKTKRMNVLGKLLNLYYKQDNLTTQFLTEIQMPSDVIINYGSPNIVWVNYTIAHSNPRSILIDFQWLNKTATRLPESLWLTFSPIIKNTNAWKVQKIGELVSPLDVILNGSRHLHGFDSYIEYSDISDGKMHIESLDSGLVCFGEPTPFPTPFTQPDITKGVHFNLFNNIWGTNYIMWYPFIEQDANTKFRFIVNLG